MKLTQTSAPSQPTHESRIKAVAEWVTSKRGIDLDPVNLPAIIVGTKYDLPGQNGRGWILAGGVGSGKTVRAQLAAVYAGLPMQTAGDIVARAAVNVTESNRLGDAGLLPTLDFSGRACEFDLIIDDLGTEPSAFSAFGVKRDLMAEVLLARLNLWPKVRTYITTNLNKAELHARYGERVASRLFQACAWIPITHPDRRAGN